MTKDELEAIELHGDQLYSWFKEKFPGHKDALSLEECRAMFRYAIEDARPTPEPVAEEWLSPEEVKSILNYCGWSREASRLPDFRKEVALSRLPAPDAPKEEKK